jgi:hypothetical protein
MSYEFPTSETKKMPKELKDLVDQLSPFHKKYCEYRGKGLSMADATSKAGSKASSRKNLSKIGWIIENQTPGTKDYIDWLIYTRAATAMVDSIEIVNKLRKIIDDALLDGKYDSAVKATIALGDMIGAFDKNRAANPLAVGEDLRQQKQTKNDVGAFKEEGETPDERARKLSNLIQEVGRLNKGLKTKEQD